MFGENRFSLQVLPGFQICFKIELVVLYLPGFNSQDALPWLQVLCPPADRWGNLQKGIPPRRCKPGTHSSLTELRAADTPGQPSAYPNKKGSKKRYHHGIAHFLTDPIVVRVLHRNSNSLTVSPGILSELEDQSHAPLSSSRPCVEGSDVVPHKAPEDSLGASLKILGSWKIYE